MSANTLARTITWTSWAAVAVSVGVSFGQRLPPGHRVVPYLLAHGALTALSAVAYVSLRKHRQHADFGAALRTLLVGAVVARVVLVPSSAFTTTDPARYLWDGAVALSGHDPYALTPADPALAALAARFPMPLDHHDVATCYPPLAIALFALAAATGPTLAFFAWKILLALASSATVLLAFRELRDSEAPERLAWIALSPILMFEAGVGAHLDTFAALSVVASLVCVRRERWGLAALAAGCAGAVKIIPGLVVIPLFFRAPRKVQFVLLAAAPAVVTTALAFALGMTPPGSLGFVAHNWSFAAPLWTAIYHYFPYDDDRTRAVLGVCGLLGFAAFGLRPGPIARNLRDAFAVGLLVSPVLYPWYGMTLAALSAFAPTAWSWGLFAALPLSYEVLDGYQATGRWTPQRWPMYAIVASVLVGALIDVVRAARSRNTT